MTAVRVQAPDLFAALDYRPVGVPPSRDEDLEPFDDVLDAEDLLEDQETNEVAAVSPQALEAVAREAQAGAGADALRSARVESDHVHVQAASASSFVDVDVDVDVDVAARRGFPWAWITMTAMLASGLLYVLATETDLFEGDLVARRQAQTEAEVARVQAALEAEAAAKQRQYGTLQINSTPAGARVWLMQSGPRATFPNLPRDGEYHIVVQAAGHVTRGRVVKGSELAAPVMIDLDPLGASDAVEPSADAMPDLGVPRVGSSQEVVALDLRTNTPNARLGLLLGWTPGVSMIDLDTSLSHEFAVDLPGHTSRTVVVKPNDWQDGPDGVPVSVHNVALSVVPEEPGVPEDEVLEIVDDEPEPAATSPKTSKKVKKRKKRRNASGSRRR